MDKVAGPVGQALIITAFGLAAAVPAVLGYNALVRRNRVAMELVRGFAAVVQAGLTSGARVTGTAPRRRQLIMAMSLGSEGDDGEVLLAINTTPLVDVMLVLLIIISIRLHAVISNLPGGKPPPVTTPPPVVTVDIDFDGTVLWDGSALADHAALETNCGSWPARRCRRKCTCAPTGWCPTGRWRR